MAVGTGALNARLPGAVVAAAIAALCLGTLAVLAAQAGAPRFGPADWAALRFTVTQAAVSAVISAALAVPVARALARRRFAGRGLLVAALGAPFLLPVIVAVLGLLAVFGRNGALNTGLAALGLPPVTIYGFHGVVLAHVFLNLPLAVRMLLQGWAAIPAERFRLAASLGLGARGHFRHVEAPMLRAVLPGAVLAVFLICLTSFAVALILGGGPRATTLELAIFQAVRFEFDLPRAALLAGVQVAVCALAVGAAARLVAPAVLVDAGRGRVVARFDAGGAGLRLWDGVLIAAAALFLLAPMAAVLARGLPGVAALPAPVWEAAARSVAIALVSAGLSVGGALAVALAVARGGRGAVWIEAGAMLPLAASSLVLGTGLFLLVFPFVDPGRVALPVTALVNAVLALPFALRLLLPEARALWQTQGRLATSLGMPGLARLRLVTLPRLRRPLGLSLGVAAALSMGDLGVIVLFAGGGGAETLPMQVWRLMGSYRTEAAEAAAVLLMALSFGLFWLFDRGGRLDAAS